MTVTALDNLIPVTWNRKTLTRYEHVGHEIPKFVKYLRTFGEAGIVKDKKDGKAGDRGITMMFVGANSHAGNCYKLYNPVTSQVCETRDIIWCGRMYFISENCDKTKLLPVIAVPIANDVSSKDLTVTEVIKVALPSPLERNDAMVVAKMQDSPSKEGWTTVTTKKGRQIIPPGCYDPATGKTGSWNVTALEVDVETVETGEDALVVKGYYDIFNVVDLSEISLLAMHHMQCTEFANLLAGVDGGFKNTKELKVMNYQEAVSEPDGKRWKAEVENEYQQMLANKVFKVVLQK
jgi:hypothetical protein